jgi:hypothetical protein
VSGRVAPEGISSAFFIGFVSPPIFTERIFVSPPTMKAALLPIPTRREVEDEEFKMCNDNFYISAFYSKFFC